MFDDDRKKESQASVFNCVVMHRGKVLLVRRDEDAKLYPGAWSGVSGFLDGPRAGVDDAAREGLRDEIGIPGNDIVSLRVGEAFEQEDSEHGKTRTVHPVFVEVSTDELTLDREAGDYAWVDVEEARQYELTPDFDKVLDAFSL